MCMTDPLADMLTRIRNASRAGHQRVEIPASKMKMRVAEILRDEGFIQDCKMIPDQKQGIIEVSMKYGPNKEPVIDEIVRVSSPGRRTYVGKKDIPLIRYGMGISILSTSKGILTDKEARAQNVGGELLCKVW